MATLPGSLQPHGRHDPRERLGVTPVFLAAVFEVLGSTTFWLLGG